MDLFILHLWSRCCMMQVCDVGMHLNWLPSYKSCNKISLYDISTLIYLFKSLRIKITVELLFQTSSSKNWNEHCLFHLLTFQKSTKTIRAKLVPNRLYFMIYRLYKIPYLERDISIQLHPNFIRIRSKLGSLRRSKTSKEIPWWNFGPAKVCPPSGLTGMTLIEVPIITKRFNRGLW